MLISPVLAHPCTPSCWRTTLSLIQRTPVRNSAEPNRSATVARRTGERVPSAGEPPRHRGVEAQRKREELQVRDLGFRHIVVSYNRGTEYVSESGAKRVSRQYKAAVRPSPSATSAARCAATWRKHEGARKVSVHPSLMQTSIQPTNDILSIVRDYIIAHNTNTFEYHLRRLSV